MTDRTPEQLAAADDFFIKGFQALGITRTTPDASILEAKGWEVWLKTIAPTSFAAPFSDEHREFWELFWSVLMRKRKGEEIPPQERDIIFPLGRGGGKSTHAEMAAIAEGCILGEGLCLYLSDSQLLAEEHLFSVKSILESPQVAKYYPQMSRPKIQKTGSQAKYTQDTIICENGWAMTARGAMANVRGGRVGTTRFTLVILDDLDNLNDSLMVIEKKKRIISRTVLPAMAKTGLTVYAQNPITSTSLLSQVINRKCDLFSQRTVIGGGPVKSFNKLQLEQEHLPNGQIRWTIVSCEPNWKYFNIADAQSFLARSGKEAFLAEYQHEFNNKRGKVISNYDPDAQIITWSEFERVYGTRYIPQHWRSAVGLDVGYSDGMHPHYSAWMFLAVAAMNTAYPGAHFIYRSKTYKGTSIDDQAIDVWRDLLPDKRSGREFAEFQTNFYDYPNLQQHFGTPYQTQGGTITTWQMSHERTGEMLTLNQKYGMPFYKFKHWGKEDGVAQWNTLSLPDFTKPNPFKPDEKDEDGYIIGRPALYYVVDDDQLENPRDDRGHKLFREQLAGWDYVPTKINEQGLSKELPSKVNEDTCLAGDTLVTTVNGDVPIRDIRTGDLVLTRDGYKPVLWSGMTGRKVEVLELTMSNGINLIGTPNHPVFLNGEFVPLHTVRENDKLTTCHDQKLSFFKVLHTLVTQILSTPMSVIISGHTGANVSKDLPLYIEMCGYSTMAQCLLTVTSIIKTMIGQITTFLTWNVSPVPNTPNCTIQTIRFQQKNHNKMLPQKEGLGLKHGVKAMQANSTWPPLGLRQGFRRANSRRLKYLNALNVKLGLKQDASRVNFAVTNAGKRFAIIIYGLLSLSVNTVTKLFLFHAPELGQNIVVTSVHTLTDRYDVYNLSVAEKPEFFANGILVHNCDPVRSLLHYFGMEPTPLTKMESIRAKMPVEMQEADTDRDKVNRGYWLQQEAKRQQIQEQQKQAKSLGLGSMGGALDRFDKMRGR